MNLKLGSSSIGESSSAGLTSTDGPSTSSQLMAQLKDTEYDEEDGQSEEGEDDDEERTLTTGHASLSSTREGGASVGRASVGGASVGGASVTGVSMGSFGSRSKQGDGFSKPKAPLAKQ